MNGHVECPHSRECGACTNLGIDYPKQLLRKERVLDSAFAKYRSLARVEVEPCLGSPKISGYRNRAKMAVGISRHEPTKLGYFAAGSREIVDAPECRVLAPELLQTVRSLRKLLRSGLRIPRELRHIDVRCGTDPERQHLTLVLRTRELPRVLSIEAFRKACPGVNGISVNLNPSPGPRVIRGPILHQWGSMEVFVEIGELSLRVSAGSFFQVNLEVLPKIQEQMAEFFDRGRSLLDLYAGVGTHALALAERFERITAIEGQRSSAGDAKATIKRFRLHHMKVVPKPVERSLKAVAEAEAECVVVNPSRAGVLDEVLDALADSAAQKIAYLSCEPGTLSRDLDRLVRLGFKVVSAQPIDMMPQTSQVEALALLRRR